MSDTKKIVKKVVMAKAGKVAAAGSLPVAFGAWNAGIGAVSAVTGSAGVSTAAALAVAGTGTIILPAAIVVGSAYAGAKLVGWVFDELTS